MGATGYQQIGQARLEMDWVGAGISWGIDAVLGLIFGRVKARSDRLRRLGHGHYFFC